LLERTLRRQPAIATAFNDGDIAEYKIALAKPGRLSAGLNYYRAAMQYRGDIFCPPQEVAAETLLIWGEQDPFLGVELIRGMQRWAPKLRVELIPQASHWVQNEVPEIVNRTLLDFLGY
jgi:epoxide hydrolase 4